MYRLCLFLIAGLFVFTVGAVSAQQAPDNLVELKNQYSGKCLAVRGGSTKHGAALMHKDCGTGSPDSIWEMRVADKNTYRIANRNSGLCLGVEHKSKKDGAIVTQVSPCDRIDTLWSIAYLGSTEPLPDISFPRGRQIVIRNNNSNKCLALVTGDEIKQYGCPPHRAKTTWQFVEPSGASSQVTGRVYITDYGRHLFPFYTDGKTYLFGLTSGKGLEGDDPIDNAANWWVINNDPATGFTRVGKRLKMSSEYSHLTPFTLNNHPYIFGLHAGKDHSSVGANIWRINDDPSTGFKLVLYGGKMSTSYESVVSFQLKGEPYILGLHWEGDDNMGVKIWQIKEDSKGVQFKLLKTKQKIGSRWKYDHIKVFYMNGHPYIFGVHRDVGANIWRVRDDPSQGLELVMYGAKFPKDYAFVSPFHVNGRPYLFAASLKPASYPTDLLELGVAIGESLIKWEQLIYQPGKGYGVIWEIGGDPQKPSIRTVSKAIKISENYWNLITFEQGGKAYIFGFHAERYGNIWRVSDDPANGFSLIYYGKTGKSVN